MIKDEFITSELRRITKIAIRDSWQRSKLKQEIERLFSPYYTAKNLRELIKSATPNADYEYISSITASQDFYDNLVNVFRDSYGYFADQKIGYNTKIADIITRGLTLDKPSNEIISELESEFKGREYYAKTVVRTAKSALSTITTVQRATDNGINRFRYTGPPPERPLCQQLYGNIYTIEEINQLSAINGYDILVYRGRWNCRHNWQAVV